MLGFPRGDRTLVKAEEYEHGGISLHECVIPHLVSRRTLAAQSIGIDLGVSTPMLTGGVVPVVIRPAIPPARNRLAVSSLSPFSSGSRWLTIPRE